MAKTSAASKIKLSSFDDLFGDAPQQDIIEIPLDELHSFKNHPFQVNDDADMEALITSIKLLGKVLEPALVRPRLEGGYELISGHRRTHASRIVGLKTMPAIVKELSDEDATVIMVDSNLHREKLLPSEKAFAYKMKMEALSHQGVKMEKAAAEQLGDEAGESGRNIQRYIRLTELLPELLSAVDNGSLGIVVGVEISYLRMEEQEQLCDILSRGVKISTSQALQLKKYSQDGELSQAVMELVLMAVKPEPRKVVIKQDKLKQYFPEEYSSEDIMNVIFDLLEDWKNG